MAYVQFQPPEQFNFRKPDEWPRWRKRFEQFRIASGLSTEGEERQVNTLLYCLGDDAEDVLRSTNISEEDRKKFNVVRDKFDQFFQVRKNVIIERARFNSRSQQEGESSEQYIAALYHLSESCEYAGLKDEMIRDRLVVGIRDKSLAERLQMDSALTLERAKTAIRQREAIQDNKSLWRGDSSSDPIRVDAVKGKTKSDKHFKKTVTATTAKQCTRCGKGVHKRDKCPARDAVCHKCHKKGHYSACCLSKSVANVTMTSQQTHSDTAFLDTIGSDHTTSWTVKLNLLGVETMFKLDTGAEATAISEHTHAALGKPSLSNPSKILYAAECTWTI